MAEQTSELHIFTLGPPGVRLGKHPVSFPIRKTLALLIYLASEAGLQPRGYASLVNTLGHLQTALGQAGDQNLSRYLSVTHQALGLNPDAAIDFDFQTVERAYEMARADRSIRTLCLVSVAA